MFEKEAEEYAKNIKDNSTTDNDWLSFDIAKSAYLEGVRIAYNKANEWHYVKDGDLPKEENRIMLCYCCNGYHGNIGIYVYRLYTKKEFHKVIAWCELPVPPKESE